MPRHGPGPKRGVQGRIRGDSLQTSVIDLIGNTPLVPLRRVVPRGHAIAGAFAKVLLSLGTNKSALMIPTQAIIPQARGKKVMLYTNGMANLAPVTTGVRDTAMVEITSGLKAGDTVLITGLLTIKSGSKVQLNPIK